MVLVFETGAHRHTLCVGSKLGNQLAGGGKKLLYAAEYIVDLLLRGLHFDPLGEDHVDEVGTVGARFVGKTVDLAHDILREHETV